jgi:hypothetical protein
MAVTTIDIDYYEELERLAKIGRATEKAFEEGRFIYDVVETYEGVLFEYAEVNTIDELLEWSESEEL